MKKFNQTKTKIQLLPDEQKEAKAEKANIKQKAAKSAGGSMEDLEKMILAKRENAFGGLLNYMESKYGDKPDKGKPGKKRTAKEAGFE